MQNYSLEKAPLNETNREPRCPCVLLLDTSGSMDGEPVYELNEGIQLFATALKEDSLASLRVEPLVVTFDDQVVVHGDFVTADEFDPPSLSAGGETKMGRAVLDALELIEERKKQYKSAGVAYYRPWIVLITDGNPTDESDGTFQRAIQAVRSSESQDSKRVAFFSIAVGGANTAKLAELSSRAPAKLKGLQFRELFQWLSASLSVVSSQNPGAQTQLPPRTWDVP